MYSGTDVKFDENCNRLIFREVGFIMKRYLIVKIGAIGDVIMSIPMIETIRRQNSDAHITWICGKSAAAVLRPYPIEELIIVDEQKLLAGSLAQKLCEILKIWIRLKLASYDVILTAHTDWRYRILSWWCRGKEKRAFSRQGERSWPVPGRHHTDEYIRLVTNQELKVPFMVQCMPWIDLCASRKDLQIDGLPRDGKKVIILAPGGAKNALADDACRRWPLSSYVALAKMLVASSFRIVLIGAASDKWVRDSFSGVEVCDFIGKTKLEELLFLFACADAVVLHDSGPMHLAGLMNIPIFALFGPTNPYEKVPLRDNVFIFWDVKRHPCVPCYDGKTYACCQDNVCLKNIRPERVYHQIKTVLQC